MFKVKVIIPAAGYATRLYPLTKNVPKALLDIGKNKTIMNLVLDKVAELPYVTEVIIISNSKFYSQFFDWAAKQDYGFEITVLDDGTDSENYRLGAIGDKYFAIEKLRIDEDILDICSDNLFEFSLTDMYKEFKKSNATTVGVYDVKDLNLAKKYGIVQVDSENKVTNFLEKPEKPPSTLASTGIYMYPKKDIRMFKTYIDEGGNPDNPGYFIEWLHTKTNVFCYSFKGKWFDIGSIEQLEEARKHFSE